MSQQADKETENYLKERKQEFEWLKKTILQRGDTILRVAQVIVSRQKAFFIDKERPIKPLTLKEVATEIDVHESTVSRAVNGKYLETDFGVFELKNFSLHEFLRIVQNRQKTFQQIQRRKSCRN